jgi:hypothetical protein
VSEFHATCVPLKRACTAAREQLKASVKIHKRSGPNFFVSSNFQNVGSKFKFQLVPSAKLTSKHACSESLLLSVVKVMQTQSGKMRSPLECDRKLNQHALGSQLKKYDLSRSLDNNGYGSFERRCDEGAARARGRLSHS